MNFFAQLRFLSVALLLSGPLDRAIAAIPDPLPFPETIASTAPKFEAVLQESVMLKNWIGGYPPRIRDAQQRQEIYARWKTAIAGARALQRELGDTEPVLLLLGRLYRQGHNLDVRRSGEESAALFERALKQFPDSDALNLEASYLYLSINPKFAPKGEAALLKLRQLRGTDRDIEIERGFIFAYLYQNRVPEAKTQVERCLEMKPDDKMLLQFRDALKRQTSIETKVEPAPALPKT